MTSLKAILVISIIFLCVGLFGEYAGYDSVRVDKVKPHEDAAGNWIPSDGHQGSFWTIDGWTDWAEYVWTDITGTVEEALDFIPGVGFISKMLLFDIQGMPEALSVFFWLLTFILTFCIARVVAGALAGGGG